MQNTIWNQDKLPFYQTLNEDIETEILVIGGGICGILCAYYLSENHRVVLVEGNRIASSRTGKTTAVITALQDIYYKDIIRTMGKAAAKQYLEANLDAIEEYEKLSLQFNFNFERVNSYKYFKEDLKKMTQEKKAIDSLGYSSAIIKDSICFPNQAQMNPIQLISQLVPSFQIFENTKIVKIKNQTAYTESNTIHAQHIIVATGYPFLRLKGAYPLKLSQKKSYVAVVETINPDFKYNAIGSKDNELYFRTYEDKLIIGGNDQKTGKKKNGFSPLIQYIQKNYPEHNVSYQWVNQDCVSIDGIPYIGKYFKHNNIYVATGFNLWGMTGSMIAALVLKDSIENRFNPYASLFDPYRYSPILGIAQNFLTACINLLKPKKRCTHLGCALFYNREEECYECPCHGTKYSSSGEVIFNPAQKNKTIK
ncbi:MAG: FAD-dependent oxidoreductase [Anaeroplasmataceae bacterium]|nr:FAD-dependent oxidoreductase [Anaeroplasmataceae bacterium]